MPLLVAKPRKISILLSQIALFYEKTIEFRAPGGIHHTLPLSSQQLWYRWVQIYFFDACCLLENLSSKGWSSLSKLHHSVFRKPPCSYCGFRIHHRESDWIKERPEIRYIFIINYEELVKLVRQVGTDRPLFLVIYIIVVCIDDARPAQIFVYFQGLLPQPCKLLVGGSIHLLLFFFNTLCFFISIILLA